ncbi:MAG: arginine N-succinyltransferase [Tepidisphaeraceae bacterium]|jgi:arginine N-succinyltransferase
MVFIRPVSLADLDPLEQLAQQAGAGLTTLPGDRDVLKRRILKSQRCIENIPDKPGGESYLLVMQDAESSKIIGASGMVSKVGGFEPFYAYRVENQRLDSDLLMVHKEIPVLHLVHEHDGPAEVGSLFLSPDFRKKDYGRFLQLVRFLFMAEYPQAFEPVVVSELRGVIDADGRSAFWDAVGKHFFEIDFPRADYLSVVNKKFIAELMPTHPIYVPLLPAEAQRVIGKVHESSLPALKNLEAEGFTFNGMVDIFDAGGCVSCGRDDIRTVRRSRTGVVEKIVDDAIESPTFMIGSFSPAFRATIGALTAEGGDRVCVESRVASVLNVSIGSSIRYATLRPEAPFSHPSEETRQ